MNNTNTTLTINKINDDFSTAAQITHDDVAYIAAQGFKTLINCRPDFEAGAEQPSSEALAVLAAKYELSFIHFPVLMGSSGDEFASSMAEYLLHAPKPALGFCRSGTRAGKLYGLAHTLIASQAVVIEPPKPAIAKPMFDLSVFESRVLGVLIEKRFLTPDTYPLSLNSLTLGCNQLTAREPTLCLSETAVKDTLDLLQERKLIAPRQQAGARVIKYEHRLYQQANLDDEMLAVLCVLLLRGPQTIGEIKQRTERMVKFTDLIAVQATLERLADLRVPYAMALPKAPGAKEIRYIECLSHNERREYTSQTTMIDPSSDAAHPVEKGRLGELEADVVRLKRDLDALTNAFLEFKRSFG
jgi:uncharacterized protein